ncbi:MAG: hypothetical protein DDG58_10950 [Ardenticatenia bacterium]|jgi:hypothetical protein|nr:MAG: hypothetical protein DDG58_10950 [Ardenticatenia bacterium]
MDASVPRDINGRGRHGRRLRRSRRDLLAMQINMLLDAQLWLAARLNGRDAEVLTLTELARLFSLHGENFTTLAELLSRAGLLAPETVRQIHNAYDQGLFELLRYRGAAG